MTKAEAVAAMHRVADLWEEERYDEAGKLLAETGAVMLRQVGITTIGETNRVLAEAQKRILSEVIKKSEPET